MKTAEIVKTAKGYYVTKRYGGMNKGREFFPMMKGKKGPEKTEAQARAYAEAWERG